MHKICTDPSLVLSLLYFCYIFMSLEAIVETNEHRQSTSLHKDRSKSHIRFRRSVPNLKARSSSPRRPSKDSTAVSVPDMIAQYIKGNEQMQILTDYDKYRSYIFSKARRLRDFVGKIPKEQLKEMTEDDRHFNIGLSHIIMKMIRIGELDLHFDNLKREVFERIENWIIDWVRRKLEYKVANRRLVEQQSKMNDMFSQFYKKINNKKYESFP